MSGANFVPLSDLSRLEQTLDAIFAADAVPRQLPIYLTEYGYETNPPNPYRGVRPATQAVYLDEAAYLAWRDPRVRSLSQFLLRDSPPDHAYPRGSARYWSTFQTGLEYADGSPKPALSGYRVAIFVPVDTFARGGAVSVWGMLRAAANGTAQRARIQWRASGRDGAYRTVGAVATTDPSARSPHRSAHREVGCCGELTGRNGALLLIDPQHLLVGAGRPGAHRSQRQHQRHRADQRPPSSHLTAR